MPEPSFGSTKDLEIGFDIRLIADFGQQERIDVTTRGNEIEIAANAGLGRVDVAEVVGAVDDPEFLVAGGEIEDLFVFGKDDECGEAELRANGNNVFLRILHDARRRRRLRRVPASTEKPQRSKQRLLPAEQAPVAMECDYFAS